MTDAQPGALPLRPLTVGELLDAAVTMLRVRGPLLLGLGLALAAVEQVVLFPLRTAADVDISYWPDDYLWSQWLVLVAVGFAFEAFAIALLGIPAGRAAPRALLGRAAPRPEPTGRPLGAGVVVAVLVGAVCGLAVASAVAGPVTFFLIIPVTAGLWMVTYGLAGLAAPTVAVERCGPFRALGRSIQLAGRGFVRTARVRLLAYLSWFLIRLAWGLGVLSLIGLVYTSPDTATDRWLMAVVYLGVNAVAYPMLACLDTVLYLEARMRSEGLDIALRRSLQRRVDPTPVLTGAAS